MIISRSVRETEAAGESFGAELRRGDVIALEGDLGAGKTHFVKGLARALGISEEVTSPTFTLVHEYSGGRLPLYHCDFYRLENEAAALALGLDEYFEADGATVIEWADRFPKLLPAGARRIRLVGREPELREISIE